MFNFLRLGKSVVDSSNPWKLVAQKRGLNDFEKNKQLIGFADRSLLEKCNLMDTFKFKNRNTGVVKDVFIIKLPDGEIVKKLEKIQDGKYLVKKLTTIKNGEKCIEKGPYSVIERVTTGNGEVLSKERIVFTKENPKKIVMSELKTKYNTLSAYENMQIKDFESGQYIKTEAVRSNMSNDYHADIQDIQTNITDKKAVEAVVSNPYYAIHNYDQHDFIKGTSAIAKQEQGLEKAPIQLNIQDDKTGLSERLGGADMFGDRVTITYSPYVTKEKYADTVNHEYRHIRQMKDVDEYVECLHRFTKEDQKILKTPEMKQASEFLRAKDAYTSNDWYAYYNNLLEVDARAAGAKAQEKYNTLISALKNLFPNATDLHFGL